ncbi:hypothetical protein [Nitrososphaera sp. AFS]|uniref:hypothetical protein n=1 Tax=Nitrososphaera sp. AFS TaxID=2301191 RepID=UPI001392250B|nr:hypothetical protein [Nitrososphaera sp. AFS]NAL78055.1 hypothetical protein [Nitrososphaera sp. AFS]
MKYGTQKYHMCESCKSQEQNFRVYLRTRLLTSSVLRTYNPEKRKLQAFGWYCITCGILETDEMIMQKRKETIMKTFNLKDDAAYEKFISEYES